MHILYMHTFVCTYYKKNYCTYYTLFVFSCNLLCQSNELLHLGSNYWLN